MPAVPTNTTIASNDPPTVDEETVAAWVSLFHDWLLLANASGADEERTAFCADRADEYEDLILAAPCSCPMVAVYKVRALKRALTDGQRNSALIAYAAVADQVVDYLEALQ